jgi:hypothetical protein
MQSSGLRSPFLKTPLSIDGDLMASSNKVMAERGFNLRADFSSGGKDFNFRAKPSFQTRSGKPNVNLVVFQPDSERPLENQDFDLSRAMTPRLQKAYRTSFNASTVSELKQSVNATKQWEKIDADSKVDGSFKVYRTRKIDENGFRAELILDKESGTMSTNKVKGNCIKTGSITNLSRQEMADKEFELESFP